MGEVSMAYATKLDEVSTAYATKLESVAYADKYEKRGALISKAPQASLTLLVVTAACLSTLVALALIAAKVQRVRAGYSSTLEVESEQEQHADAASQTLIP